MPHLPVRQGPLRRLRCYDLRLKHRALLHQPFSGRKLVHHHHWHGQVCSVSDFAEIGTSIPH
ncbi:hypothetical protein BDV06DRAFT_189356 [Aspergillus oleicola]